jgi:hypothetical protein
MSPNKKSLLSISLDLDNTWSYLKIHGDADWEESRSHFPVFFPIVLDFLKKKDLKTTFFIVGKDAADEENKSWFEKLAADGHDVGNHSFDHEPWMQKESVASITEELKKAHAAIFKATGREPIGFRGPGFCHSASLLNALVAINYRFDASILATIIGPIARLYYMFNANKFEKEEMEKREVLFGSFSNAFMPNSPFIWKMSEGKLLEVPVTTMPLFRTPIHLSYLIWLSQFSKLLAWTYLKMSIRLCKIFKVAPSILLHPPDFMGAEDAPELSFFPGMNLSREFKLHFVNEVFEELKKNFEIITLNEHVLSIERQSPKLQEKNYA